MKGKSYLQEERTTQETYKDDVMQLEYCHNLIAQVHPNPVDDVKIRNVTRDANRTCYE